jgi:hypothetical protein
MCPFCLPKETGEICYVKVDETKPICNKPKCKGEHISWVHDTLKSALCPKAMKAGTVKLIEHEKEKIGYVNVAL